MPYYFKDGSELSARAKEQRSSLNWRRGSISTTSGVPVPDTDTFKQITSSVLLLREGSVVSAKTGYQIRVASFKHFGSGGFSGITAFAKSHAIGEDTYAIVCLKSSSGEDVTLADGEKIEITGDYDVFTAPEKAKTTGHDYRLNRMHQVIEADLTLPVGYPMLDGLLTAPQRVYGIPYSAVNDTETYVGIDVSFYTYLSALRSNQSIIFKEYAPYENTGRLARRCIYGIDCTGFISGGWALHDTFPSVIMRDSDLVESLTDPLSIQIGDLVLRISDSATDGHGMAITDIERDNHGRPVLITISDSYTPVPRHRCFFWSAFLTEINGQRLKRYKYVENQVYSTPLDYVFSDDLKADYQFPDIMPYQGDKCTINSGVDEKILVLDGNGYSSIEVYKDGTKISTRNTIADFTLSAVSVGKYEVRMIGTGKTSSCYFNVCDLFASLNGNTIQFSASGCTPYSASAYLAPTQDPNGELRRLDKQKIHLFTPSEISAGSADISDLVSFATQNGGYLKIKAYDNYGTIFRKIELS